MTQSELEKFADNMEEARENDGSTSDWPIRKIEDICIINPGSVNDNSFDYETIQYLEISNVSDGYITELEEYSISDSPSRAKRTVSQGQTVLSTVRPNRNNYVYIENPPENMVVSTGFVVLYPKKPEQVLPEYLYYAVTHPVFIDYLVANATGSAYPAVNQDIIKKGVIPVPDVDTQKYITEVLGVFDRKIKKNIEEISKLKELRNVYSSEVLPPSKME